ncbi:LuxR C-terminal-related transcriptional regulator [Actinoplanes sp. L3-i22]|uniref:helix-turn-helix transcriptional regulator n=1 Tax=Actinoplanes sp. L3-i22 TaxID=2836373 RepID=UPI001C85523B|nr:LuxR C-terminal-related transcriptional regulator [Actinoplanes sp. L3-i22]
MSDPRRIPVAVHSADPLIHAGLTCLLRDSPGIDLRAADDDRVAVVVVVADRLGGPVLTDLRAWCRTRKVVLIVSGLSEAQLLSVLESGVSTVLFRHRVTAERLSDMVRAAARDDRDLPGEAVGQLVDAVLRLRREAPGDQGPMTERELDVLRLLADGLDTREIGGRLGCSDRTVKNVLHGITVRFRSRNRTHAVAHALRQGYL